jgi:SAM-dependent methyltransferase
MVDVRHVDAALAVARQVKSFYNTWYHLGTPPWGAAPSPDLVGLVESGRLQPCRAIDIGCGTGATSIYLASRGFDVTGLDFAPSAIGRARAEAAAADVTATFIIDDITAPTRIPGGFDLLVDHGTFDDLTHAARAGYVTTANQIAAGGTSFYLWCFEWEPAVWERALTRLVPIGNICVAPGDIERHFAPQWTVDQIASAPIGFWPRRSATYLMTKKTMMSENEGNTSLRHRADAARLGLDAQERRARRIRRRAASRRRRSG